ncbi:MAG TPA: hypothetical protein VLC95_03280 [Anaerolineae bacterium]|nr:hypothetical protein [Anaerolineae bacterium]
MAGESKRTRDHEKIKQWVKERGGYPATVADTGDEEDPGILRIDFPGYGDDSDLVRISWDAFFEKFDDKNLEMLYQDEMRSGSESRFVKFVSRGDGDD